MSEWKEYSLEEITEPIKETYIPTGNDSLFYIGLEHIEQESLRLNSIGKSTDVTSNKFKFIQDDVLFGKLRPYFRKVVKPNFSGICSTDIWVLRAKKKINQNFLFYFIANWDFVNLSNSGEGGTRMPRADWNYLKQTRWTIPSPKEQTAIASVLSSLDDKIDLLHRQNATLEKMAETLFRQWFVEEAKENWETGKLVEEFDYTMGTSPPGESYNEESIGIPMYQGNADFGSRFPTNRVFTTDPKRFAEKYDTLVSVRAPVGEQNMANERCCIGRGVAAFRFKKDNSFYTYTYYKIKSLMNDIKQFNETGTVFGSINKSDFENIEITIPDMITISQFQIEVKPIDNKIIINTNQICTLIALRDALLLKFMSREIKINL